MALYKYKGRNRQGRIVQGRIKGEHEKDVRLALRENGVIATEVTELKGVLYQEITFRRKVKLRDFVIYLRQFATMVKAGISVVNATEVLAEQTTSKPLKQALEKVLDDLREGNSFSDSAERQRHIFPPLFTNMIRAGEAGGNVDNILERLAEYYEKQHRTKQKVMSALSYPFVVGMIAMVVVVFLLSYVVPAFANIFRSYGEELPLMTQFVLQAGVWFQAWWWGLLIFGVIFYSLFRWCKQIPKATYYIDSILLKVPLFGQLFQKAALARLTRTLSSLLASSVPVLQAFSIAERVVGNEVIATVIRGSRNSLERGESITSPMKEHWVIPLLVTQMIAVGEKAGSLDTMLDKIADFYEAEVDATTDRLKTLIEPFMIVLLAGIVGIIVAAIVLPMFEMFGTIN
ncbi:type II secretion system F family protein [Halalkalibacterium ligniniphilum]|uniref:type II secretion system F family protein n=1 Tax=Halalkalibacterium ligniniphilum TaxID=1134413 RepID=UPI00034CAF26|nr:type II secretion system F family protein [Halalkalibacterium ligniniphilum]